MRLRFPSMVAALVLALALLPAKGGCGGQTACIKAKANGVCPAATEASTFFFSQCGGPVRSVDGEGVFDGQFCCYPVTAFPSNGSIVDFPSECGAGGAVIGTGGFGTTTGVGGAGGFPCQPCSPALEVGTDAFICPGSQPLWDAIDACACADFCAVECSGSICAEVGLDSTCLSCLQGSCPGELTACKDDF